MDALAVFNAFEAVFWIVVGMAVCSRSRSSIHRKLGNFSAAWFVVFGISDVFEIFSGAWWRPWPLLLLKASCVIVLIVCGVIYRISVRRFP